MSEMRIGTRERELAMGALDEHLREGRLDPTEYGERSAVAANARFRSELDALFTDLPAPHPAFPGGGAAASSTTGPDGGSAPSPPSTSPPSTSPPSASPPSASPPSVGDPASSGPPPTPARPERDEEGLPDLVAPLGAQLGRHAGKLSALAPVIAIGLFVLTGFRFPQVFLLVPLAIALLGWLGHRHGG